MDPILFSKLMKNIRENIVFEVTITSDFSPSQIISILKALELNTSVKTIYIYHAELPDEVVKVIEELLLINLFIQKICFSDIKISEIAVFNLIQGLSTNKSLKEFQFYSNNRINDYVAGAMFAAISKHPNMKVFNLFNASLGVNAEKSLNVALYENKKLTTFYLYNIVDIKKISKALQRANLTKLYLCNSNIDDIAFEKICIGLAKNQRLQYLYLYLNKLSENGFSHLIEMLKINNKIIHVEFSGNSPGIVQNQLIKQAINKNLQKQLQVNQSFLQNFNPKPSKPELLQEKNIYHKHS